MASRISAVFALAMILVFLGFYAVKIASIPLIIIIVSVLAMAATDFLQTMRESRNQNDSRNSDLDAAR